MVKGGVDRVGGRLKMKGKRIKVSYFLFPGFPAYGICSLFLTTDNEQRTFPLALIFSIIHKKN